MKAIILKKPGDFAIEELPLPEPGPGEVLLKIMASGICTNDVRDFKGECSYTYPRIGGHEYGGVIEKLGPGVDEKRFPLGAKAVQYIIDDCKSCHYCKRGEENICAGLPYTRTFQNPGGLSGYCGFAEYIVAKAEDVFLYPEQAGYADMAFTEPLACAVNSVNRTAVSFGDDVLVIGGGTMGLLHVILAKLRGARVILSEPMEERRQKALALGCSVAVDPMGEDLSQRIGELTGGRGAQVVFNTTAVPSIARQAVELTAPGGMAVMFSSMHPNEPVPVDMGKIHSFQKTVTGAVSPTIKAYYQATELIGKHLVDLSPLLEAIYPYEKFGEAMAAAMRPDTYKVMLKFGDWA